MVIYNENVQADIGLAFQYFPWRKSQKKKHIKPKTTKTIRPCAQFFHDSKKK